MADDGAGIEVQAAAWVSVSSVTVYVNGVEVKRWSVPRSTDVVRFHQGLDVTSEKDGWVVARVDAFLGGEPRTDDVTLVLVRRDGRGPKSRGQTPSA